MSKIKKYRLKAGLSRAEMSRQFEIPLRTLEGWEYGEREPAAWAEKLIIEKLEEIIAKKGAEPVKKTAEIASPEENAELF